MASKTVVKALVVAYLLAMAPTSEKSAKANANSNIPPKPIAAMIVTGKKCEQKKPGQFLICDEAAKQRQLKSFIRTINTEGKSGSSIAGLTVDFSTYYLVAIYLGDVINCESLTVEVIDVDAGKILVRYKPEWYQTDVESMSSSSPFALILMPITDKKIVIEEDIQNVRGGPPIWKHRAELLAPKK